jgi:hypothetical protein
MICDWRLVIDARRQIPIADRRFTYLVSTFEVDYAVTIATRRK